MNKAQEKYFEMLSENLKAKQNQNKNIDEKIKQLELKFKQFEKYDKIFQANNFELKNTLKQEKKINELNKKNKTPIILDKTYCLICHKKQKDHIDSKFCYSQNFIDVYKPKSKKLIEVKV